MLEKVLRFLTSIFPNNASAHYKLAIYLSAKAEKKGEAEEEFRKVISLDPRNRLAYYYSIGCLLEKEDSDAQIENLCNEISRRFPTDPITFLTLGYVYENRKQIVEAEEAYRKSLSFAPRLAIAYERLIDILMNQQRFSEALLVYHQAKDLLSRDSEKYYMLSAYTRHIEGKFSEAVAAYKNAIRKNPRNGNAYLNLGLLLDERLNKRNDAEQAYKKAIQCDPTNPEGYIQLGWLLFEHCKRYDEAGDMFLKVLEYKHHDETVLYNLACIKVFQRDPEAAFMYLAEAIQNGFDRTWAWDDPDLKELHDDPRFIEIVGMKPRKKESV
jgi:tetratricopeptide (TPR) repeat protein